MLGDLIDREKSCLQNSRDACESHSDDMCSIMTGCDPCDDVDESSLLEDLL